MLKVTIVTNGKFTTQKINLVSQIRFNGEKWGEDTFNGYSGFINISVSLDEINNIKDLKVDSIQDTSYIITANVDGKSDNLNNNR